MEKDFSYIDEDLLFLLEDEEDRVLRNNFFEDNTSNDHGNACVQKQETENELEEDVMALLDDSPRSQTRTAFKGECSLSKPSVVETKVDDFYSYFNALTVNKRKVLAFHLLDGMNAGAKIRPIVPYALDTEHVMFLQKQDKHENLLLCIYWFPMEYFYYVWTPIPRSAFPSLLRSPHPYVYNFPLPMLNLGLAIFDNRVMITNTDSHFFAIFRDDHLETIAPVGVGNIIFGGYRSFPIYVNAHLETLTSLGDDFETWKNFSNGLEMAIAATKGVKVDDNFGYAAAGKTELISIARNHSELTTIPDMKNMTGEKFEEYVVSPQAFAEIDALLAVRRQTLPEGITVENVRRVNKDGFNRALIIDDKAIDSQCLDRYSSVYVTGPMLYPPFKLEHKAAVVDSRDLDVDIVRVAPYYKSLLKPKGVLSMMVLNHERLLALFASNIGNKIPDTNHLIIRRNNFEIICYDYYDESFDRRKFFGFPVRISANGKGHNAFVYNLNYVKRVFFKNGFGLYSISYLQDDSLFQVFTFDIISEGTQLHQYYTLKALVLDCIYEKGFIIMDELYFRISFPGGMLDFYDFLENMVEDKEVWLVERNFHIGVRYYDPDDLTRVFLK